MFVHIKPIIAHTHFLKTQTNITNKHLSSEKNNKQTKNKQTHKIQNKNKQKQKNKNKNKTKTKKNKKNKKIASNRSQRQNVYSTLLYDEINPPGVLIAYYIF